MLAGAIELFTVDSMTHDSLLLPAHAGFGRALTGAPLFSSASTPSPAGLRLPAILQERAFRSSDPFLQASS